MNHEVRENLVLHSTVSADGLLRLELAPEEIGPLQAGEILVEIEAAPINPSDIAVFMGAPDLDTAKVHDEGGKPVLTAEFPGRRVGAYGARLDKPMLSGNEGAGTVVDAADDVKDLIGRKVGMLGGAMYARYRKIAAQGCMVLPEGKSAAQGAALFVNPLTALAMVETMRMEGHGAIVHTAAASNLGQMLTKICVADGVGLVNIVRNDAQAQLLRDIGAEYVVNSSLPSFRDDLYEAVAATGATIAFDAIGGGRLVNDILHAMEKAALRSTTEYNRYGSTVHKQVYIYGSLDFSLTELDRGYGMKWGIGGFLLTYALQAIGQDGVARMRQRVLDELDTTFASHYSATIGLADMLDPDTLRAIAKKATGEKYLVDPRLGNS